MSHLESAFTVIFIVEFTLKHLGLGVQGYWGETWNRLDGFIVLSSVFELVMIEASSGGRYVLGLSQIQARCLPIVRP